MQKFASGKIRARKYRNRRIGEFLKELELSEKQSTGITILRELKQNGSPMPDFETDPDRTYLITTLKVRDGFEYTAMSETKDNEAINEGINGIRLAVLCLIREQPSITYSRIASELKISEASVERAVRYLREQKAIERVGSKKSGYWRILN